MTTDRQREANRRNARKSTGPRTAGGKAASSGNARRHGLTAALDLDTVASWYRLLLEDATAVPDPFEQDPYRRAAVELARAEAHLQRVRATEERWLCGPEDLAHQENDLEDRRNRVLEVLMDDTWKTDIRPQIPEDEQWLLSRQHPAFGDERYFEAMEAFIGHAWAKVGWDPEGFGYMRHLDQEIARIRGARLAEHERMAPTFARYRALAEARRLRALARWIDQVALHALSEAKIALSERRCDD